MKLNKRLLRSLVNEELKRLSYASKGAGFTYGIEHLPDYYEPEKADDIIGHTWLTHVRKKGSSLNEVGYVLWHSLNESGHVAIYDVEWPDGSIETNIPAHLLEKVKDSNSVDEDHNEHGVTGHEEDSLLSERKYKKRRKKRRKKRKSRKSKKAKPNKYQRTKYKARAGTRRGDTMARLSNKIRKGKKLTKADYKARDDSEAAERKKKGYKSKPRFDTGMYLSEAVKRELDAFVEMLDERKKRRKRRKKRKSTKKKRKSSAGKLSAKTKETLKKKANRRGLTPSSVYAEYRKGLAAYYSSGSRKGMSAHQWAHARVNSANPSKSWAVVKKAKKRKKK